MSLRIWTVFGLESQLAIAVIVMTVSATALAENPNSSDSLSTGRDSALATARNNPIQCEVSADVKTDEAVLACKFPLDIAAYQLGFYVLAYNANQEEKEISEVIMICYWENALTASFSCLPKVKSNTNGKYEKSTNKTILSITMAAARPYNLSCHLSQFTLESRPCQLTESVHQSQRSCNLCSPVFFVLLLLSSFLNAILLVAILRLFMKFNYRANKTSSLWTAGKDFCKTSRSSSVTYTLIADNPESPAVLPQNQELYGNKPDRVMLSPFSNNIAKYFSSHTDTRMRKVLYSRKRHAGARPQDASSGKNTSTVTACTKNVVPKKSKLEQSQMRRRSNSPASKYYAKSPAEKFVIEQGEP